MVLSGSVSGIEILHVFFLSLSPRSISQEEGVRYETKITQIDSLYNFVVDYVGRVLSKNGVSENIYSTHENIQMRPVRNNTKVYVQKLDV